MGVSITRIVKFIRKGERGNGVINAVTPIRRFALSVWKTIGTKDYVYTWANISNCADMKIGDTMVVQGVVTDKGDINVTYYGTVSAINTTSVTTTATALIMSGEDGNSFAAQYSINGETNWHDTFTDGDIYMRTSKDGGKTWSEAIRIVGEKGGETNYQFGWSSHKTLDDSEDPLSDIVDWSDYPPEKPNNKDYLWTMITAPDGKVSYARLTGEKGDKGDKGDNGNNGKDAVTIYVDPTTIVHKKAATKTTYSIGFRVKDGANYVTGVSTKSAFTCSSLTTLPSGITYSYKALQDSQINCVFVVDANAVVNVDLSFKVTYKGIDYICTVPFKTVENGSKGDKGDKGDPGDPGSPGAKGDRGPALRGPQAWNDCAVGYVFQSGADGEDFKDVVLYNNNYYSCVKSHAKATNNAPLSTADTSNGYWKLADKFEVIATKILLAQYALVKNLGVEAIDMKDSAGNIIFQAKDGNVICNRGTFNSIKVTGDSTLEGIVKANMYYGKAKKVTAGATYAINPQTEPYNFYYVENPTKRTFIVLPKAADYEGLEINVFTKMGATASLNYRTVVKAQANDDFYVKQNSAIISTNIAVEQLQVDYTNFKNDAVTTTPNCYLRFKCFGGAWYAISGVFTGE